MALQAGDKATALRSHAFSPGPPSRFAIHTPKVAVMRFLPLLAAALPIVGSPAAAVGNQDAGEVPDFNASLDKEVLNLAQVQRCRLQ